jgi:cytochrome c biogenesis protein CcmG/thiol:disulfide interchange protein DsbE
VKRPPFATGAVVLLAVLLTGLIIYGVLNTGDDTSLDSAVKRGEQPVAPAADVSLPALDGRSKTSLADLRGKVVVLNFWASWCDPCRDEAPILERAQRRLQRSGAGTVLGVTYKDFADESRRFERELKLTYASLRDDKLELAPKFGTSKLPETFVLDRRGHVVAISRGQIEEPFLTSAINRALKSRAPA